MSVGAGDIEVSPDVLRQGAADAAQAAQQVSVAASAVEDALPWDAFGLMCSYLFMPRYQIARIGTQGALTFFASKIAEAGEGLRDTAAELEAADDDAAAEAGAVGGDYGMLGVPL